MNVTVVTGHTPGEWDALAAITLPGLAAWCDRHGYDLMDVPLAQYAEDRPASWGKLPALVRALHDADIAVWVDADAAVCPDAPAIHEEYGVADAWQALVVHHTVEGTVPGCGVWLVTPPMIPFLREAWEDYREHRWWEQAAIQRLMGFDPDTLPVQRVCNTGLWIRTATLDPRWSVLPGSDIADAYTRHAPGGRPMQEREAMLRQWATEVTPC